MGFRENGGDSKKPLVQKAPRAGVLDSQIETRNAIHDGGLSRRRRRSLGN